MHFDERDTREEGAFCRWRMLATAGMLFLATTAAEGTEAARVKLSGMLQADGDVQSRVEVSPDGQFAVYVADAVTDEAFELWSVRLDGRSDPLRLSAVLPAGSGVDEFQISRDSRRVVYLAPQEAPGVLELFSVPLAGGARSKLNHNLTSGGAVRSFALSADSTRVVYLADQETDEVNELYVVSIGGGTVVKLNQPSMTDGDVHDYAISVDSSRVVYRANLDTAPIALYSVPITGGTVIKLNAILPSVAVVSRFTISGDSTRVVFLASEAFLSRLYSVPIGGGAVVGLNGGFFAVFGGDAVTHFRISGDSTRVVFLGRDGGAVGLFSIDIRGGPAAELQPFFQHTHETEVLEFVISDDSSGVVFRSNAIHPDFAELFATGMEGFLVVPLSPGEDIGPSQFTFSPDSKRVVYRTNVGQLFSVSIFGGGPTRLSEGYYVGRLHSISPDSSRVVFAEFQPVPSLALQLVAVPIAGGNTAALSPALLGGAEVKWPWPIAPDSARVAYVADQEVLGQFELFVADQGDTRAAFAADELSLSEGEQGEVYVELDLARVIDVEVDYQVTGGSATGGGVDYTLASGTLVFPPGVTRRSFFLDVIHDEIPEAAETVEIALTGALEATLASPDVVTVHLIDTGADHRLSGPLPAFTEVSRPAVSPDGGFAVYLADGSIGGVDELYSVSLPAGTPVRLSPGLPAGRSVTGYVISPDSAWVVYRADAGADDVFEIFSVPIGGGGGPVRLNGRPVTGGSVGARILVSADSRRVVYRADQDVDGRFELYSVPIAGGAAQKLNGELPTGGDVKVNSFTISADSSRVVYRADESIDTVNELYSAPIAGGGTSAKLNAPLTSLGDVSSFRLSADSSRVVYRADQQVDGRWELYSVPIAGGAAAPLNGTLATAGDVLDSFAVSPGSSRVIYRADESTDGVEELYSVAITGGTSTKLNPAMAQGGNVLGFGISKDSSRVVYRADQQLDEQVELYSLPITGPGSAGVRLNATMPEGGRVLRFRLSSDSSRAVYLADQEVAGVDELYSVPIAGGSPVKLSGPMVPGGNVESFLLGPEGTRVLYRADRERDGIFELYQVPISGPSTAGVKLNRPLAPVGEVTTEYVFNPRDGSVLFLADVASGERAELYVADAVQAEVGFESSAAAVSESAGTVAVIVRLTAARVVPVSVELQVIGGSATGGGVDFIISTGTLTFPPGVTTTSVDLQLVDDGAGDPGETVELGLSAATHAAPGLERMTLTLLEDAIFADGFESGDLSAW